MTNILEEQLNRDEGKYEVLNFGRKGANTIDHIEFLRDAVIPLRPDFVLLRGSTTTWRATINPAAPRGILSCLNGFTDSLLETQHCITYSFKAGAN
jgi:hypothetical protein